MNSVHDLLGLGVSRGHLAKEGIGYCPDLFPFDSCEWTAWCFCDICKMLFHVCERCGYVLPCDDGCRPRDCVSWYGIPVGIDDEGLVEGNTCYCVMSIDCEGVHDSASKGHESPRYPAP